MAAPIAAMVNEKKFETSWNWLMDNSGIGFSWLEGWVFWVTAVIQVINDDFKSKQRTRSFFGRKNC